MTALDTCSPYLRDQAQLLGIGHQAEIDGAVADLVAERARNAAFLSEMFGTATPHITAESGNAFWGEAFAGVDMHANAERARENVEDPQSPGYHQPHYRGCIELLPDGTWKRVRLFKGDESQ